MSEHIQDEGVVRFSGSDLRGSLAEHSLSQLLVGAALDKATGRLRVSCGRIRKVIYLQQGHPVYVDSNLRNETLGAFLVSQQVINESQLAEAVRHARKQGSRLGQALIELGYADSATITAGLSAQTQIKIAASLRWSDGNFSFAAGDDFSGRIPDSPINAVRLVLAALKQRLQADEIDVDPQATPVLTEAGRHFAETIEAVFGEALLQRCEAGLPLSQPSQAAELSMAELCLQLTVLLSCGLAILGKPAATAPTTDAVTALAGRGGQATSFSSPTPTSSEAAPPQPPPTPTPVHIPPALAGRTHNDTFDALLAVPATKQAPADRVLITPPPEDAESLDASSTDKLDLEPITATARSSRPMVLALEDLDPTRASMPELPEQDLEFLQPAATEVPGSEDDSGILALPPLDDLELEDRDPKAMVSKIATGIRPLPTGPSPALAAEEFRDEGIPAKPRQDSLVTELKQTYENVHEKSYYELLGISPSANERSIEQAYRHLKDRFDAEKFLSTSTEAQKCADLQVRISQASSVLLDPLTRHAYDERLGAAKPQPTESRVDNFGAELFFQDGQNRLRAGDVDGAVRAFSQAIQENVGEPQYHALLGWALFIQRGRGAAGAQAARPHFKQALQIAPDSAQVHELAAQVERNVRDHRATAFHLTQALAYGTPRMDLFDQLRDALRTLQDYSELERQYRLMVFRLRSGPPEATVSLWVDLAYLHHEKLGQPHEAAVALDVAMKLAPNDPRVQAARASIGSSTDPGWEPRAERHRQRALDNPNDDAPLHDLVSLHKAQSHTEELLTLTGVLVGRDRATADERKVYEQLRPTKLSLASSSIAPLLEKIKLEDDDPLIESIIAQLSPVLCRCDPITLEDLGSSELELLADIGLPKPFADVLSYVCRQLQQQQPELYLSSTVTTIIPMPTDARRLMVSQRLLDSEDEPTIAFAAARALSCIGAGRRHAFERRARVLKNAFVAAFSFCRSSRKRPADPDGVLEAYFQALEDLVDRDQLALLFAQVRGRRVNLSDWIRSVRCSAARIGMLLSGDPGRALALVDNNNTRQDLITYALSPEYSRLRNTLGISATE